MDRTNKQLTQGGFDGGTQLDMLLVLDVLLCQDPL